MAQKITVVSEFENFSSASDLIQIKSRLELSNLRLPETKETKILKKPKEDHPHKQWLRGGVAKD